MRWQPKDWNTWSLVNQQFWSQKFEVHTNKLLGASPPDCGATPWKCEVMNSRNMRRRGSWPFARCRHCVRFLWTFEPCKLLHTLGNIFLRDLIAIFHSNRSASIFDYCRELSGNIQNALQDIFEPISPTLKHLNDKIELTFRTSYITVMDHSIYVNRILDELKIFFIFQMYLSRRCRFIQMFDVQFKLSACNIGNVQIFHEFLANTLLIKCVSNVLAIYIDKEFMTITF